MAFNATVVASVQQQIAPFPLSKLLQFLEAIDVLGGAVTYPSGVVSIGGRALTNQQYEQLYEMLSGQQEVT